MRNYPSSSSIFVIPTRNLSNSAAKPLIERDPLLFWKCLSAILFGAFLIVLALLIVHYGKH